MNEEKILERLVAIIDDLFDVSETPIGLATEFREIPDWDSFAIVQIVTVVEKEFGTSFTSRELKSIATVGDLVDAIAKKTS